jgi:GTP-binding protein EngB required for normal cell division
VGQWASSIEPPIAAGSARDAEILLLAHMTCAGGLLHLQAESHLRLTLSSALTSEPLRRELEKILGQDDSRLSIGSLLPLVVAGRRPGLLQRLAQMAALDGYLDYDEVALLHRAADAWQLPRAQIEQRQADLDRARQAAADAARRRLSWRARLVGSWNTLSGRSPQGVVADDVSGELRSTANKAWLEYLLGVSYPQVIESCVRQAREDYPFSREVLAAAEGSTQRLQQSLAQTVANLEEAARPGHAHTARSVLEMAKSAEAGSQQHLRQLGQDLRGSLERKRRSLDRLTIVFMGRTKAGKSTLHAVLSRGGRSGIGYGMQATTRTLRTYEWERLRILDTPGFGAAMRPEDATLAKSVLPESDIVCLLMTDDSQQQSDFEVLSAVRALAKPLIIVINFKLDIEDPDDLQARLASPGGLMPPANVAAHEERIRTYATHAFGSDHFAVISVHLFAALLALERTGTPEANVLWRESGIQRLLDALRVTIIEEGPIRRSQTLLGMLPGEFAPAEDWANEKASELSESADLLRKQGAAGVRRLQAAAGDAENEFESGLKRLMLSINNRVPKFAEQHWSASGETLRTAWATQLQQIRPEHQIQKLLDGVEAHFSSKVEEILKETAMELQLSQALGGPKVLLAAQDSSTLARTLMKVTGIALTVTGALLALAGAPLTLPVALVALVIKLVASLFESQSTKRAKAVRAIEKSLRQQLDSYHAKVEKKVSAKLKSRAKLITLGYTDYFTQLADATSSLSSQISMAAAGLGQASADASRLFAKRVVDWAENRYEPLSRSAVDHRIDGVRRAFGVTMTIFIKKRPHLKKSAEALTQTLQERITFEILPRRKWRL